MIKKYNVALLPTSKDKDFIECAQSFSAITYQYQLGKTSLPHITLCQFHAQVTKINSIWTHIIQKFDRSITLTLNQPSCISFDNQIFWISLLPDSDLILHDLHKKISNILNVAINPLYDPHLTLLNTKNIHYQEMVDKFFSLYSPISDHFFLAIGESDPIGQFTQIVKQ